MNFSSVSFAQRIVPFPSTACRLTEHLLAKLSQFSKCSKTFIEFLLSRREPRCREPLRGSIAASWRPAARFVESRFRAAANSFSFDAKAFAATADQLTDSRAEVMRALSFAGTEMVVRLVPPV